MRKPELDKLLEKAVADALGVPIRHAPRELWLRLRQRPSRPQPLLVPIASRRSDPAAGHWRV